jgi:uncharacterized protein YdhG (YjbR/CyaY superfamily)
VGVTEIDDYIGRFPTEVQSILRGVRQAIREGAPGGDERIRYGMPAIQIGGDYWLHFAGWKNHVGLYPVPRGDDDLEQALAEYRAAKDSVNFLYSKTIPYALITRVAQHVHAVCTTPATG